MDTDSNNEIAEALKEFESRPYNIQPENSPAPVPQAPEIPKLTALVIKYSGGSIKDRRQAEYILLGFVIVAIIISLFLFFSGDSVPPLPPEDLYGEQIQ